MGKMNYTVRQAENEEALDTGWDGPGWARAETLEISHFRPESGDHRPPTSARLVYSRDGIQGLFRVQDQFVRCVRTSYFGEVWKDSCVEFFAQPKPDHGYFNLEFNCGGAFLCSYIVNPERTPEGFKEFTRLPPEIGQTIQTRSTLPRRVEPEIAGPVTWALRFFVPFALFEHYVGPLGDLLGQSWRANFYKCGDETSHPHWASWSPLDQLNFHRPNCFGTIRFG